MNSSLLTISVIAVLLPGAFVMALGPDFDQGIVDTSVLDMSHGVRPPASGVHVCI